MPRPFSADAKRVLFEALVIAHAAKERTVTPERIVSAVLHTDAAVELFRADLCDAITPGALRYSHLLRRIDSDLSEKGFTFGSPPHMASIHPLPMDEITQRALIELNADSGHPVTPLHILLALLETQDQIAKQLATHDVTPESIRSAIDKTKGA